MQNPTQSQKFPPAKVFTNQATPNQPDRSIQFQFRDYGINWARWARDNAVYTLDYTTRTEPTPGNKMLPTFGLCELHEARLDATNEYVNEVGVLTLSFVLCALQILRLPSPLGKG